jgi:hypothetical protein
MRRTIGCSDAARVLGISEQFLRYRASVGKIRVARRSPLRFNPAAIIQARPAMRIRDRRGRKALGNLEALLS